MINNYIKKIAFGTLISIITFLLCSFASTKNKQYIREEKENIKFPYLKAGLTQQQAAEHLLSRFTFGVRPQDIDAVTKMGLEKWFTQQLDGNIEDEEVSKRLTGYDALTLTNEEVLKNYPKGQTIKKMAIDEGVITEEQLKNADKKDIKKLYDDYRAKKGFKEERELYRQFINQKIIRATYSNNQLHELLTDFWFNHFNVSMTKNQSQHFIPAYERDAIRPNVIGKFEDMLLSTAKSPAMLTYLDNFSSTGTNEEMEKITQIQEARRAKNGKNSELANKRKAKGLNENYAREVMELHTLGVDGGYSQQDVTEAARVLTGWTLFPISDYGGMGQIKKVIDKFGEDKLTEKGFVRDGDFLFAKNLHDDKPKTVLGKTYTNEGYEEGVSLLKFLASHPSTAKFISKKLATRFINDHPAQSIIDKMTKTFLETNGDIKKVLTTMVSSPEFWAKESRREKTKSPFEFAISSIRALQADVKMPFQINNWIAKMGQKLYFYQAPTGFPDKAQYWINTGSLLNRMNFGLALAGKRIPGVQFDLAALNEYHEPESAEDALQKYSAIVMPQRDLTSTIKRLTPLVNDATVSNKINEAAEKNQVKKVEDDELMLENEIENKPFKEKIKGKKQEAITMNFGDNSMLAQVVGIIIGSPEFQRK